MFATSEAKTYTYMSVDKILHKDYIVQNNIHIRTNNPTGNSSMVHGIVYYYIVNQIKSNLCHRLYG